MSAPPKTRLEFIKEEESVQVAPQSTYFGLKMQKPKSYHMILTNQPRLFFQTVLKIDECPPQKYKKDILLHRDLKVMLIQRGTLMIKDTISGKTYKITSNSASEWVNLIN